MLCKTQGGRREDEFNRVKGGRDAGRGGDTENQKNRKGLKEKRGCKDFSGKSDKHVEMEDEGDP